MYLNLAVHAPGSHHVYLEAVLKFPVKSYHTLKAFELFVKDQNHFVSNLRFLSNQRIPESFNSVSEIVTVIPLACPISS